MSYATGFPIASEAAVSERAAFIRRTYGHVAGAILAFVGLEALLMQLPGVERFVIQNPGAALIAMLAFIGAGYLARYWANSETSPGMQYLGLGLYVAAEAVIFLPLLFYCKHLLPADQATHLIATAGILTLGIFGGLTAAVFITGNDFSYLRPVLTCASFIAVGFIVCAVIFGFSLGLFFSFAMVALACGFILYGTSNVLHHYRTDQHVGAALELFAAVALLFWYIIQILMASRD